MTSLCKWLGFGVVLGALSQVAASAALPPAQPVKRDPLAPLPITPRPQPVTPAPVAAPAELRAQVAALARQFDGKAGIAIVSLRDGWEVGWNSTVLFPQQSCSKLWVAITALDAVDRGRVSLGDQVTMGRGDLTLFHQPIASKILGGGTTITRDVLPFSKTAAERGTHAYGLNSVGLERRGFTKERIRRIHHAYKLLLASKLNTSQALEKLKSEPDRGEDVDLLIKFVESSERGVIK